MTDTRTVAILGGGFAGLAAAHALQRQLPADWQLRVLSQDNYITFAPLLPEVVGASLLPSHVVSPLRQTVGRAKLSMVRVTDIDFERRRIGYAGEGHGEIGFDHLVLALGQGANLGLVKGMADYALPLKTLGDAMFLRNRLITRLEQAELQSDAMARRWLTSFVVIGGGFSGVETAGELYDFLRASLHYYPNIRPEDVQVHLVHSGDCLLPELSSALGRFTGRKMEKHGVRLHLNARAIRVDANAVHLDNGTVLSAGTIVCTIGTAANPLIAELPLPMTKGRVNVLPDLSVPDMPNVWCIGDCAAVPNALTGELAPPTAQFADRQGRLLARNLCARIAGRPTQPFGFRPIGQLATVGHNRAVAEFSGVRVAGFVAWLLWRGTYLLKMPTFARKVRLFLEWNWSMFFPPDIAHLGFERTRRHVRPAVAPTPAPAGAP